MKNMKDSGTMQPWPLIDWSYMSIFEWKDRRGAIERKRYAITTARKERNFVVINTLARSTWLRTIGLILYETKYVRGRGGGLTDLASAA